MPLDERFLSQGWHEKSQPKNQQKMFCISALVFESGGIKKIYEGFFEARTEIQNIFVGFLVQMKTLKFAFEIN